MAYRGTDEVAPPPPVPPVALVLPPSVVVPPTLAGAVRGVVFSVAMVTVGVV